MSEFGQKSEHRSLGDLEFRLFGLFNHISDLNIRGPNYNGFSRILMKTFVHMS